MQLEPFPTFSKSSLPRAGFPGAPDSAAAVGIIKALLQKFTERASHHFCQRCSSAVIALEMSAGLAPQVVIGAPFCFPDGLPLR